MSADAKWWHRFDGWINPIAVKELRQAVQGKFIMGILLLFLTIAVITLGVVSVLYGEEFNDFSSGEDIFVFFLGLLMGICLLFLPLYSGVRLSFERSDNVDLLYATTLKAGAIIRGKLLSATILCFIIYSICTPFMTLTYLLRGIDLLSIFFLLGASFLMMVCVIQIVLFLASLPVNKWFKLLLAGGALFGMSMLFAGAIVLADELLREGIGSMMATREFWLVLGLILALVGMAEGLLYVLSVAIISPNTVNRALPVRLYLTSIWLITGAGSMGCAFHYTAPEVITAWGVAALSLFGLVLMASISEREVLGPRIRRSIPTKPLRRIVAFFFYSGAGGGLLWCSLILALTIGVMIFSLPKFPRVPQLFYSYSASSFHYDLAGMLLYLLGYALMGIYVRRKFLSRWFRTDMTWGISAILTVILCVVPIIIAFFLRVNLDYASNYMWYLGNPGAIFWFPRYSEQFLIAGSVWAGLGLILNLRWLMNQIHQFEPLNNNKTVPESS
ncbi:MAG: hypothetical protein GY869_15800 [Planctomycetes bacterium]|nr:hypothetical protein [Planctomycetota bacterium]